LHYSICKALGTETTDKWYTYVPKPVYEEGDVTVLWNQVIHTDREDLSKYQLSAHSLNIQQYICYTTLLNMFRAACCSSSGGPIVSPQPLVSSPSLHPHTVRLLTEGDDTRGCGDTIGPPDDRQRAARNMLGSVM